jgi:hypothetical protein
MSHVELLRKVGLIGITKLAHEDFKTAKMENLEEA